MESVTWCGGVTPCIRVKRVDQGNDTVSEGMCYGALASAYLNDRPTFDGLWNLYRTHFDSNGLMNWQYNSSGGMIGNGEATDAAEDCAIALIVADKRGWGTPQGDTVTYHQRALVTCGIRQRTCRI
jgi:endoglucanase